jgi:hypothetical protein
MSQKKRWDIVRRLAPRCARVRTRKIAVGMQVKCTCCRIDFKALSHALKSWYTLSKTSYVIREPSDAVSTA